MLTKAQCEKLLNKTIRQDTYQFIVRMMKGEQYEDIYIDLDVHRKKYELKENLNLSKKDTIINYIELLKTKEEVELEKKKEDTDDAWKNEQGVYGIYIDSQLIYIGKTNTSFATRFKQHASNCKYEYKDNGLYRLINGAKQQGRTVEMKPLIILNDLNINKNIKITDRDLCFMELALIDLYKPIGNVKGRIKPYDFGGKV